MDFKNKIIVAIDTIDSDNALRLTKIIPDVINVGGGFPSIYPDLIPQSLKKYFEEIKKNIASLKLEKKTEIVTSGGLKINSNYN